MVAIDLDGTLLSGEGLVTPRTKAAIHAVLAAGLRVCFATGRNWTESKATLAAVDHHDTAVFVGGAMVVDTRQEHTLHRTMMRPALASELCAFLETRGFAALALQDTHTAAGVDYLASADLPLEPTVETWVRVTRGILHRVHNLSRHDHAHTLRVSLVAPRETAQVVMQQLTATFGDRIVAHAVTVMAHDVDVIEVFDPAVNKWQGILKVSTPLGIRPEQIIAVGDDMNDLPMIRQAGLGVAMGNARPEVKAVADRVIGSNREDGLARFLEELVDQHRPQPLQPLQA